MISICNKTHQRDHVNVQTGSIEEEKRKKKKEVINNICILTNSTPPYDEQTTALNEDSNRKVIARNDGWMDGWMCKEDRGGQL